jgi:hypothetical protein
MKGEPMERFIPYEKLSKKKQRELNTARRGTWTINPVTRKPANPKAYNRKTARNWKDDSNSVPFVFAPLKTGRRVFNSPAL